MKTAIIFLAIFQGMYCFSRPPLRNVELKWKPTSSLEDLFEIQLSDILQTKIKFGNIIDARGSSQPNKVGENRENSKNVLAVETSSDVAAFVSENVKNLLKKRGLNIVSDEEDYTLSGELLDLFVTEENIYKGNVAIKYSIKKKDKTIWTSTAQGSSRKFGRSYSYENYLESISESIFSSVQNLLENESFRKQLKSP